MDIIKKINKHLKQEETISEGFFSDMVGIWKLSVDINKYTENFKFSVGKGKSKEDVMKLWDKAITDVEEIVSKSNISQGTKDAFYNSAVGGLYGELYKVSGMSGGDIQKALGWSNDRYNKLSNAYLKSKK